MERVFSTIAYLKKSCLIKIVIKLTLFRLELLILKQVLPTWFLWQDASGHSKIQSFASNKGNLLISIRFLRGRLVVPV